MSVLLIATAAVTVGFLAGWVAHHHVVGWHSRYRDDTARWAGARDALARNAAGAVPVTWADVDQDPEAMP